MWGTEELEDKHKLHRVVHKRRCGKGGCACGWYTHPKSVAKMALRGAEEPHFRGSGKKRGWLVGYYWVNTEDAYVPGYGKLRVAMRKYAERKALGRYEGKWNMEMHLKHFEEVRCCKKRK